MILVAHILDVRSGHYVDNAGYAQGERVKAFGTAFEVMKRAPAMVMIIDLGDATLLPGLIDCHTHLMAAVPEDKFGYELNLATKSQAYRALEGSVDARVTLEAGFTAVRAVESEDS